MLGLWLENGNLALRTDLPLPTAPKTEALVRVHRAGLCATDHGLGVVLGEVATDDKYEDHRKSVLENWREVFLEDVFAVEGMQAGRRSPAYQGGVFSPVMDQHTLHFHQWVADKYLAASES